MSSYRIPDSAVKASSQRSLKYAGPEGRLNKTEMVAWCAGVNNASQWLRVDLSEVFKITALATQGLESSQEFVKSFILAYSMNGVSWISSKKNGAIKVKSVVIFFL